MFVRNAIKLADLVGILIRGQELDRPHLLSLVFLLISAGPSVWDSWAQNPSVSPISFISK